MKSFRRRCLGVLLPSLLLVLPACQRPEEVPKPADLLPKEKMITLLADLHVLEARVESSRLQPDSARALYLAQEKELLAKRAATDSAFQRSYRYYFIHGKDLDEIYKAVIDTLRLRQEKLNRPKPALSKEPPHTPPAK